MTDGDEGTELTAERLKKAVKQALDDARPRPVVDSAEVQSALDGDYARQTVRNRLKEVRHISTINGYRSPKWLWYLEEANDE